MSTLKQKSIHVVTRDGTLEPLDISIVRRRLEALSFDLNLDFVNLDIVVHKVEQGVHDRITTAELDSLAAETCAYMVPLSYPEHRPPSLQHPRREGRRGQFEKTDQDLHQRCGLAAL
jgi:hypothetical protein